MEVLLSRHPVDWMTGGVVLRAADLISRGLKLLHVIPAKAGIQRLGYSPVAEHARKRLTTAALAECKTHWIPAFAGLTGELFRDVDASRESAEPIKTSRIDALEAGSIDNR